MIAAIDRGNKIYAVAIDGNALGGGLELSLACDYRVATGEIQSRSARNQARPAAGCRRNAAFAAPDRRASGARVHAQRRTRTPPTRRKNSASSTKSSRAIRSTAAMKLRCDRQEAPHFGEDRIHRQRHLRASRVRSSSRKRTRWSRRKITADSPPTNSSTRSKPPSNCTFPFGIAREARLFERARALGARRPRCVTCSLRNANSRRSRACRLRNRSRSRRPASSARARWAAASRSRSRKPASRSTIVDSNDEAVDKARQTVMGMFMYQVQKGTAHARRSLEARPIDHASPTTGHELKDADVVVEAVFENMDVKKDVFAKLDAIVKPEAILATQHVDARHRRDGRGHEAPGQVRSACTSSCRPTSCRCSRSCAARTRRRRRWPPRSHSARRCARPPCCRPTRSASSATAWSSTTRAKRSRSPKRASRRRASTRSMKAFGFPMGPFAMFDLSGIDVAWHIQKSQGDAGTGRTQHHRPFRRARSASARRRWRGYFKYDKAVGKAASRFRIRTSKRSSRKRRKKAGIAPRGRDRRRDSRPADLRARQPRRVSARSGRRAASRRHRHRLRLRLRLPAAPRRPDVVCRRDWRRQRLSAHCRSSRKNSARHGSRPRCSCRSRKAAARSRSISPRRSSPMREAVIVSAARTPIGRAFRGAFNQTPAQRWPDTSSEHAMDRAGIIAGRSRRRRHRCPACPKARPATTSAAPPRCAPAARSRVAGSTVSRFCASGLDAIAVGRAARHRATARTSSLRAASSRSRMVQNDINLQHYTEEWLLRHDPDVYMPMLYTADNVAKKYDVSRERQDEYAFQSQQRTAAAQAAGASMRKSFRCPRGNTSRTKRRARSAKSTSRLKKDEGNRADTTLEGLASSLKGAVPGIEDTTITAGNSSQLSDGAAAVVVMDAELAAGARISARWASIAASRLPAASRARWASGRSIAVPKLLTRHGLKRRRHRPMGAQRSVRGPDGLLPRHARHPQRTLQRRRRRDFDRPSLRHERHADDDARADRGQAPGRQVRRRHDVRRRGHGRRRSVRGRLTRIS